MKRLYKTGALLLGLLMLSQVTGVQARSFRDFSTPTNVYKPMLKPAGYVVYFTGDAGMNDFSQGIVKSLVARNYAVGVLDVKKFCRSKRSPAELAKVFDGLLNDLGAGARSNIIALGYSLGADMMPFTLQALPVAERRRLSQCILLSPSEVTDFEVHLIYSSDGEAVLPAIRSLNTLPFILIHGQEETDSPVDGWKLANARQLTLPGGHHYDNQPDNVVAAALRARQFNAVASR